MTRLERLLGVVADRPDGEKVNIAALIRAFTPTQAETIAAIEHLIKTGKLDRETLRRIETPADASAEAEPTEPPAPGAAEDGGDARITAPPPKIDDDVLQFFSREWELLRFPAKRWGWGSVHNLRGIAVRLRERGLLEMQWRNPQSLWRLAQPNTTEAPGTPREGSGAEESTSATRIEDHASNEEPASTVAPSARARLHAPKVDLKVNARRDPTRPPDTPIMDLRDRQHANGMRRVAQVNRGIEQKAAERLDAGEKGRNSVESAKMAEIERRRADEFRLTDSVEQAKTVIRIAGWRCFAAVISGGPVDHYYIGNRVVPEAELLAFAERLRTDRRRRA